MRNIFKDLVNDYKLIRILHRASRGDVIGNSAIENILEAKNGANYMYTIGGITGVTVSNIDELMKKACARFDPNVKITGVIVFMDK